MLLWGRDEETICDTHAQKARVYPGVSQPSREREVVVDLPPRSLSAASGDQPDQAIPAHWIVVAAKDQVSCKLGEEFVVLDMKRCYYYGLKHSAAHVWGLLLGRRSSTVAELRDSILEKYEVGEERTEKDLVELLGKMRTCGLIEVQNARLARAGSKERSPLMQEVPAVDATVEVTHRASSQKPYLKPSLNEYGTIEDITRFTVSGVPGDNRTQSNQRSAA